MTIAMFEPLSHQQRCKDWSATKTSGNQCARIGSASGDAWRHGGRNCVAKPGELADLEAVAQSWLEDAPDIAQAIQ